MKLIRSILFLLFPIILMSCYLYSHASADLLGQELALEHIPDQDRCVTERIHIVQDTGLVQIDACVEHGNNFDIAHSSAYGASFAYVRPENAEVYTRLDFTYEGATPMGNDLIYSPSSLAGGLFRIRNLSSNLRANYLTQDRMPSSYGLDWTATPEQILPYLTDSTRVRPITTFKVTANNRYLVAFTDNQAFVKYDIETNTATTVFAYQNKIYPYGKWTDVAGVSDDGRYIFVGRDGGIIDTDHCGISTKQWDFQGTLSIQDACTLRSIKPEVVSQLKNWLTSYDIDIAQFINESTIKFHATPDYGPITGTEYKKNWYLLTIPHSEPEPNIPRLEYLALGDSYSSGEGDVDDDGFWYKKGTDGEGQCHLSLRSYPYLLRDAWNIASDKMASVACSGAKVLPDFYGGGLYYGQHNELLSKNSDVRVGAWGTALSEFSPGIVRQIDFVSTYQPKILTFTGGGNDVGFADIITYCAASYRFLDAVPLNETCAYAYNSQMEADLNRTIDEQYAINKEFIERIKQVSPATQIYIIGYPQFVKDNMFCLTNSEILNDLEIKFIRNKVTRLNNVLKKVARDAGIYFIDIEDSLDGGQICEGSKYITGPVSVMVSNGSLKKDSNMYHPNGNAHKVIASTIKEKIDEGMYYEILDIPDETNGRRTVRQAVMPSYAGVGSTTTITMNSSMFKPDGTVTIELYSKQRTLGVVKTDDQGTFSAKILIPEDIGVGEHLLTLTGYDTEDKPLQVQQFVTIISATKNDIDADGVADDKDNCFVITEWYIDGRNACTSSKVAESLDSSSHALNTNISSSEGTANSLLVKNKDEIVDFGDNNGEGLNTKQSALTMHNPPKNETAFNSWWVFGIACIILSGILYGKKIRKTSLKNEG